MHSIILLLISLDGSLYICISVLIILLYLYFKTKDKELIYFIVSCISYALGEICFDYINAAVKLPLDLIFFYLFYFFIFLFFKHRTKILLKSPTTMKNSELQAWLLILIDFVIFAVFSYLVYRVFDCTLFTYQFPDYTLDLITISNFTYPLLDFLILRYFIHINMKYIVSDRKLYLPLIAVISVCATGDFITAYELVFKVKTHGLGTYLLTLGLVIFIMILTLIKISKTDSYYTTMDLHKKNSQIKNYSLLINGLVILYLIVYIYCLNFNHAISSSAIMKNSGIVILSLAILRLIIINSDLKNNLHEISKDASTDPLTGLYSRKYGFTLLKSLYKSSLYFNLKISIIMLDIDHFKNFNDSFGHISGDYALKEIAQLITGSLDSSNIVCRYGGEEFLIILPGVDDKTGILTAEKIRSTIETYTFRQSNRITVSIGGATSGNTTKSVIELIEQADAALYKAKENRNTCSWYESYAAIK